MKKEYSKPELQIIKIECEDIIRTSGGNEGPDAPLD